MLKPPRPAGAGWPAAGACCTTGGVCWGVAGGAAWESAFKAVPNIAQTTSIDFRMGLTDSPGISHGAAIRSYFGEIASGRSRPHGAAGTVPRCIFNMTTMSDLQLYTAIGLPTVAVLASLTVSLFQINGIREDIREICSDLKLLMGQK